VALEMAGDKARGADMYLTLEPCTHWGRTPPCTDAIIRSGIRRVFVATSDPNPIISGGGVKRLKSAGIEVIVGVGEREAKLLNEDFFTYITSDRPYVTLKMAQSIDGRMATERGDSKWITSKRARNYAHRLRMEATAVLVGVNTILKDNPLLTVRHFPSEENPLRVIIDPSLRVEPHHNVVKDDSAGRIIYFREGDPEKVKALTRLGVILVQMENLNLREVLRDLRSRDVVHLLVEGGGETLTGFLREGLWDRLLVFVAPKLIGKGIGIGDLGVKRVSSSLEVSLRREIRLGEERIFEYVPVIERKGLRW
ncbi:MAG: bifunctional diaminohydroxyphosphoribosylaminopyrimidine deaminase/5-amino-6-(5-phosphoribosylamino)uracil reductase RibD, partial [Aquificota bacterium]|nr:bifunctional diaminohydroxyphosphoribosylaminopyrimidine deaminase/5-amino-6-(5-phosphoribosylamino)uracil reductase RibD [Aquificota bacterium]